ncbi:MAG TPA: hypothetical protein VGB89_12765 [Bacteroidota bacterium]
MIKLAYGGLVMLEVIAVYLFQAMFQISSGDAPLPVNPVYAALLGLLNLVIIGIGFITFRSSEKMTNLLHKMDRRLVRVETKLGILDKEEGE